MKVNEPLCPQERTKRRPFQVWNTLFLLLSMTILNACVSPGYYTFTREVTGRVVDAATGVPLEDVIVVGAWPGIGSNLCGDHEAMRSHIYETTTDRSGEFMIPGCVKTTGVFFHSDALVSFYKPGYFPKTPTNGSSWNISVGKGEMGYYGPGWVWQFEGSVIELEPSVGMAKEKIEEIRKSNNVRVVTDYLGIHRSKCHWLKMPRMTMVTGHFIKERYMGHDDRDKAEMPLAQYLVEHELIDPEQCHPDPVGFLMEYKDEVE
ncbi:MAG: carboxypeptidase-like regulatory domain-containing protein [Candidatus Thiodiazotropha sp. (ex Troendleina suluensis)]|nr:carboxypeptidase-like regulatory domain-containing protein [Candidatus Thiodiazotropha sp. (ex Troendleina suluensis)]